MEIAGKRIWITGASSGIGKALAVALAKKGARLVLSARDQNKLEEVKKTTELSEDDVLVLPVDLAKKDTLNAGWEKVLHKFGGVDMLVNNGGLSQRDKFLDTKEEVIQTIMDVNFFGAAHLTRLVLPGMLKQGAGKIITVSSIAGKFGFPLRTGYSASKHALHGLFESIRFEYEEQGVSVLMVCPGRVKTNISLNALEGDGQKHGEMDAGQEGGISSAKCAAQIVNAIQKDKLEIYPGGKEILMVYFNKFLPPLFRRIVRNTEAK